jgi:hypothetical protein
MGVLRFPEWQKPCEDALSESDPKKIFQRVAVAEAAIFHRLQRLTSSTESGELEAIDAMLNNLRGLVINSLVLADGRCRNAPCSAREVGVALDNVRPNSDSR